MGEGSTLSNMTNRPTSDDPLNDQQDAVAVYTFPRTKATVYGLGAGILVGIGNSFLALDFEPRLALFGTLIAAIVVVLILHEGLHGAVGALFNYTPSFGVEPPLVYTTFNERIRRTHFIAIALAPLLVLDVVFIGLYAAGVFRLFMDLCFAVNTIGAVGDMWIVLKLLPHDSTSVVQDTKTGIAVYKS